MLVCFLLTSRQNKKKKALKQKKNLLQKKCDVRDTYNDVRDITDYKKNSGYLRTKSVLKYPEFFIIDFFVYYIALYDTVANDMYELVQSMVLLIFIHLT